MSTIVQLPNGTSIAHISGTMIVVDGFTATAAWHWSCQPCGITLGDASENDLETARTCGTCGNACTLNLTVTRSNPNGTISNTQRWEITRIPHNRLCSKRYVGGADGRWNWFGTSGSTVSETRRLIAGLRANYASAHLAFGDLSLPRVYHLDDCGVREFQSASLAIADAIGPTW